MKINKQSWHYRLIDTFFEEPSRSLCIYFWQIPLTIAWWTLMTLMGGFVCFILLTPLLQFFMIGDFTEWGLAVAYKLWTIIGCMAALICFLAWKDKRKRSDKPPSVMMSYIKAKKEKICPLLEFTDD